MCQTLKLPIVLRQPTNQPTNERTNQPTNQPTNGRLHAYTRAGRHAALKLDELGFTVFPTVRSAADAADLKAERSSLRPVVMDVVRASMSHLCVFTTFTWHTDKTTKKARSSNRSNSHTVFNTRAAGAAILYVHSDNAHAHVHPQPPKCI